MKFIWHSVPLGDGIMAQEPLEEIRAAFLFFLRLHQCWQMSSKQNPAKDHQEAGLGCSLGTIDVGPSFSKKA